MEICVTERGYYLKMYMKTKNKCFLTALLKQLDKEDNMISSSFINWINKYVNSEIKKSALSYIEEASKSCFTTNITLYPYDNSGHRLKIDAPDLPGCLTTKAQMYRRVEIEHSDYVSTVLKSFYSFRNDYDYPIISFKIDGDEDCYLVHPTDISPIFEHLEIYEIEEAFNMIENLESIDWDTIAFHLSLETI